MTCRVKLYADPGRSGTVRTWRGTTGSENVQHVDGIDYRFGYNKASAYDAAADEHCMMVGYTWHGGGIHHNNGVPKGDIKMFKHGEGNDIRSKEGQETRAFNDDIDGIRLQFVPGAGSGQMQYHINIPTQTPHDYFSPVNVTGDVLDSNGTRFTPCPGGTAYFNSKSGVRCIYPKSASALRTLHGATKASNMDTMYTSLVETFCADSNNVFENPGEYTCLELDTAKTLAMEYCGVGSRIKGGLTGGDPNCTTQALGDNYAILAAAYCNTSAGRADTFCKCHNVTNGVCDTDSTAAGCAKKKQTFDKLVDATPSGQKDVWSGMESCFGQVCTGTGVFIPANVNQNCDKSVNVCIQDIDIGSLTDSNIQATCDIDAGGPPSVDEPPASTPAQESAQTELEEAEAAVARGDAGAQERLDAARDALDAAEEPPSLTDFKNNPKAYIPKSLDGLKNNKKQQIGGGVTGALVLGCMMMLLLLVVAASGSGGGGGGGGPVARRFSK